MITEHLEVVDLQKVTDYYAKDFQPGTEAKNARLVDTFVDPHKNKVVFRFFVERKETDQRPG